LISLLLKKSQTLKKSKFYPKNIFEGNMQLYNRLKEIENMEKVQAVEKEEIQFKLSGNCGSNK